MTMLNAIATTAKRSIALENDFLAERPTLLAIKNSKFKVLFLVDRKVFNLLLMKVLPL
jgi:hypothetical protein